MSNLAENVKKAPLPPLPFLTLIATCLVWNGIYQLEGSGWADLICGGLTATILAIYVVTRFVQKGMKDAPPNNPTS